MFVNFHKIYLYSHYHLVFFKIQNYNKIYFLFYKRLYFNNKKNDCKRIYYILVSFNI